MNVKSELLEDFRQTVNTIDFSKYNPNSNEFKKALYIGLMWKLFNDYDSDNDKVVVKKDDISDELDGAKHYYDKYLETKDESYKRMALDEINHGNFLVKKALSKLPNVVEKEKLKSYERDLSDLEKQIKGF